MYDVRARVFVYGDVIILMLNGNVKQVWARRELLDCYGLNNRGF